MSPHDEARIRVAVSDAPPSQRKSAATLGPARSRLTEAVQCARYSHAPLRRLGRPSMTWRVSARARRASSARFLLRRSTEDDCPCPFLVGAGRARCAACNASWRMNALGAMPRASAACAIALRSAARRRTIRKTPRRPSSSSSRLTGYNVLGCRNCGGATVELLFARNAFEAILYDVVDISRINAQESPESSCLEASGPDEFVNEP